MQTSATTEIYKDLLNLMCSDTSNLSLQNQSEFESLYNYCCEGMDTDSEKFLAALFLKALNQKICSDAINENTYQKKYEVSQIELFNILIDKFPFVKFSQQLINNSIAKTVGQLKSATIIDIGVGLGTQMVNVLELVKESSVLEKLTIIGIEPFGDALSIAEKNITAYKKKLSFEL